MHTESELLDLYLNVMLVSLSSRVIAYVRECSKLKSLL
jgi:hypothetical protein